MFRLSTFRVIIRLLPQPEDITYLKDFPENTTNF
jgi:hypothetical protein